jgi:hypothetical protein
MNGTYATIADVKGALGVTTTTDDVVMRKLCEAASRAIDNYCNRHFYTTKETKYFNGGRTLWLPDLLSIDASSLKTDEDGDGTYENTLATTDYQLYGVGLEDTLNTYPKTRLELGNDSDYGGFGTGIKKSVQIAGIWGYGDGISATPYVADTTLAEDLVAGEAAVDVASVTNLSPGALILIGSEQYYIYSIATLTLTTEPGVNGTTEAVHNNGAQIYVYQYPSDIRQACIDLCSALYQNRARQGLQSERLGDYSYTLAGTSLGKGVIESILDDNIRSYRRLRF